MAIEIRLLSAADEATLADVVPGVFDNPVQPRLAAEFLTDPRHHIVVAIEGDQVIGFASAVHYVHPDKSPELWVNEVSVAPSHRRGGLGKRMLHALFDVGCAIGCSQAWVLTDRSNAAATRLYRALGGVAAPGEVVMFEFHFEAPPSGAELE